MIHVVLRGRLGNWLFQYAVGRRLALARGTGVRLSLAARPESATAAGVAAQLRPFGLVADIGGPEPLAARLACRWRPAARWLGAPFVEERTWGWDPAVLDVPDGGWLYGYFQSERYFEPVAAALRRELAIAPSDDEAARAVEARIEASEAVAVHVRRGDYLRTPLLRVCTPDYYARALRHVADRVPGARFFVFSDDPAWCRANLPVDRGEHVDLPGSRARPSDDLRLMSRCRHHIVANSTFSWWGAWLGARPGQVVVAPARWFNDPAMDALAVERTIPAGWTRVAP